MDDPREAAFVLLQQNKASIDRLWLTYFANGGNADPLGFEDYVYGLSAPHDFDALILAWVIEEVSAG